MTGRPLEPDPDHAGVGTSEAMAKSVIEPQISQQTAEAGPCMRARVERFAFEGELLFSGLDFAAEQGRWTCLLGPSGVGKTTLLRMIAGLLPGAVCDVAGAPLGGQVGYMAQQDLLMPWLDAAENVMVGQRLRGERRQRKRALQLLEQVGVVEHAGKLPATLSGGQRQRVALARTLMEDRPIVLMDEPFSSVDAVNRQRLQTLAATLLRDRTVVLITHDPQEALLLGHKILVMSGRPAVLEEAAVPDTVTPRRTTDPALVGLQEKLMQKLTAALEEVGA